MSLQPSAPLTQVKTMDNSMNHPDFSIMTKQELRAYVLSHRQDKAAFYAYVDRVQQRPPIVIIEPEEWSEARMQQVINEIKQHKQK